MARTTSQAKQLTEGVNHIALVTPDLDRLVDFYRRVFDARVVVEMEEEGLRHTVLDVGAGALLHPFELPDRRTFPNRPMFDRGRLDHLGINAASLEAFTELRRRVVAEGRDDGLVSDFGPMLSFRYTDPDGFAGEVCWVEHVARLQTMKPRADWEVVELTG